MPSHPPEHQLKFYKLPEKVQAMLSSVAAMSPEAVQELATFIGDNLGQLLSPEKAVELIAEQPLKHISGEEAFRLLDALVPIIFQEVSGAVDHDQVVSDVILAAKTSRSTKGEKLTKAQEKALKANLSSLFNNHKTRIKSKSVRLLATQARKFEECEVLSDIRPVFKADGSMKIDAAVMFHTLRLAHSGQDGDFFVALDAQDLRALKKAVDRAIQKEEGISSLIKAAGIEQVKVN